MTPHHGAVDDLREVAAFLLSQGAIVEDNSDRSKTESSLVEAWKPWGSAARHYHLASRTLANTPYSSVEEDRERLVRKLAVEPPQAIFREYKGRERIQLPVFQMDPHDGGDLPSILRRRRSTRHFKHQALTKQQLANILALVAGPVERDGRSSYPDGSTFRTSPSGGARHPIDVFPYIRNIEGLAEGFTYYHPGDNSLVYLGPGVSDEYLNSICGDQPWSSDSAFTIFWVAKMERSSWKYDTMRAYRALMIDMGHLSQTTYLVTTDMNLGTTFTAALRDERLETQLHLEIARDLVIGASPIGIAHEENPSSAPLELRHRLGV